MANYQLTEQREQFEQTMLTKMGVSADALKKHQKNGKYLMPYMRTRWRVWLLAQEAAQ